MKKWLWVLAVCLFFAIVIARFSTAAKLVAVASQGLWYYLLLGVLLQGLFLLNQSAFYAAISRLTQHPFSVRRLFLPVLSVNFVNVAAPSANISGVALVASEAHRAGMTHAETLLLNGLYFLLDYSAFILVLGAGLIYLYLFHDLKLYELVAGGILSAGVFLGLLWMLLAVLRPRRMCRWIGRVGARLLAFASRFREIRWLSPAKIEEFGLALEESLDVVRREKRKLLRPALHALAVEVLSIATLYLVFLAFHSPIHFGVLVAGYAIGTLFLIVSITPSGLGMVEGMMTLTFTSLGIAPEVSSIVTLVYRGLTFWLPFLAGFAALRHLKTFQAEVS